jgi:glycosyltransferase involved in cell wall biosynthesis
MENGPPLLYVSFDQVPAAKGASTHIEANAQALGARFGSLILVTPGPRDVDARPFVPGVRHVVLGCPDGDLLGRVLTFRAKLLALLRRQSIALIHFRSTFEGYPLARRKEWLGARLLYEVNGLPSIELKYAYPRVRGDRALLAKLMHQEDCCLRAADRVVTVSEVTRRHLIGRGCPPDRVEVVRNGVDVDRFAYRDPLPVGEGSVRVLYSGTLSAWQGIDVLLEALVPLVVLRPVRLTLAGPAPRGRRRELLRRLRRSGLDRIVEFVGPVGQEEVARLLHASHVCVAPLTGVDRNTVQGCCPLKVLEAMAAGCPVVAADLPVVRELATPGEHFARVAADDPAGLALAILSVAEDHAQSVARARRARRHVEDHFRWEKSTSRLVGIYEELLAMPASSAASAARSAASE